MAAFDELPWEIVSTAVKSRVHALRGCREGGKGGEVEDNGEAPGRRVGRAASTKTGWTKCQGDDFAAGGLVDERRVLSDTEGARAAEAG